MPKDTNTLKKISVFLAIIVLLITCSEKQRSVKNSADGNDSVIREYEDYSVNNVPIDTLISKKCDFNTLLSVRKNLNILNQSQVRDLLFTIDTSCVNDVEFGEFSNELLFMVLKKEPELFITEFQKNISEIDTGYILLELSRPINDGIAIKPILERVENTKINNTAKERIIETLRKVE